MQHTANMDARNLLACGKKVHKQHMSEEDIAFVNAHPKIFHQDKHGAWFNVNLQSDKDRKFRESLWDDEPAHILRLG